MNKNCKIHKKIDLYIREYNNYVLTTKIRSAATGCSEYRFTDGLSYLVDYKASGANDYFKIFRVKYFEYTGVGAGIRNMVSSVGVVDALGRDYAVGRDLGKRTFFVIPSFFNSSSILHFDQHNSFVKLLQEHGDVFLLDWVDGDVSYVIYDVLDAIESYLCVHFPERAIDIVGHCIGGVIASGVISRMKSRSGAIASLTLLTCSWNFNHFQCYIELMESLGLDKHVKSCKSIPKLFIQIMFFMLKPNQFNDKVERYFGASSKAKRRFLEVEYWLQSGINLPSSLYMDLIENVIKKNMGDNSGIRSKGDNAGIFGDGLLQLGHESIDPKGFDVPVFILYCKDDFIVPKESVKPIVDIITGSKTVIEVSGGHISYLVSKIEDIKLPYDKWVGYLKSYGLQRSFIEQSF